RYGWRVEGPSGDGHRFNPSLVLLDPASTGISDGDVWGKPPPEVGGHGWPRGTRRRSLFVRRPYHWRGDAPPLTPLADLIIYELHVRGFTCHPTSGVAKPGTFAGL